MADEQPRLAGHGDLRDAAPGRHEVQTVATVEVDRVQLAVVATFHADVMRGDERIVHDDVVVVGPADRHRQMRQHDAMGDVAGATKHLDVDHLVHRIASR